MIQNVWSISSLIGSVIMTWDHKISQTILVLVELLLLLLLTSWRVLDHHTSQFAFTERSPSVLVAWIFFILPPFFPWF